MVLRLKVFRFKSQLVYVLDNLIKKGNNMENGIAIASNLEQVLLEGNLQSLNSDQKIQYYKAVCESVGLNPLTKPFEYLKFQGKEILYAGKGCAEQLRKISGISLGTPNVQHVGDLIIVSITGTDKNGRTDTDCGVLNSNGLRGDALANATMKAITKAKRRVTLSICGLGMLDESEVESIQKDDIEHKETSIRPALDFEPKAEMIIDGPIYDFSTCSEKQLAYLDKSILPKYENKPLHDMFYQFKASLGVKFSEFLVPSKPQDIVDEVVSE